MGNQASLPCCVAPNDKYEVSEVCGQKRDVLIAESSTATSAKCPPPESGGNDAPTAKDGGAFATTDPFQVAPELAPQQGLPYQFHVCGPPPPPCDDLRMRTVNALKTAGNVNMDADAIDAPPDPEIASILKLVQSIFEAPAALVALFDDRRIFVRDAEGAFKRGDFPWRWSFCGWTMASKNHQIMVIPDATKDARFCNNAMVKSGPGVRFYCGTPLVASNGHRIGTLCFADTKPREFDASRCVVLNNLAELVVRHLEKDIALQLRAHDNNSLAAAYGNLRRTLDCFDHCVALVDTSCAGWRVLFVNNPCCKTLGLEREVLQGSYISRLMTDDNGAMLPTDEQERAVEKGQDFQVTARLSDPLVEEMDDKDSEEVGGKAAARARRFVLTFRAASREDIDGGAIPIGVPSLIPPSPTAIEFAPSEGSVASSGKELCKAQRRSDRLYFMLLQDAAKLEAERAAAQAKAAAEAKLASGTMSGHSSSASSAFSHEKELSQPPESISGLSVGHLLGKGAYGSVYYGVWYGSPVAVKIIDEELPPGVESVAPPLEAILSKELRHPHIVATLRCARRIVGPSGSSHAVSGSTLAALRRGGDGSNLTPDGSTGAFSDDTARVSRSVEGANGPTSVGASCLASRRRAGGSGLTGNSSSCGPDGGWLQGSFNTRLGQSAAPGDTNSNNAGPSSSSPAGTTAASTCNGDSSAPTSDMPSAQPSAVGLEGGASQALSQGLSQSQSQAGAVNCTLGGNASEADVCALRINTPASPSAAEDGTGAEGDIRDTSHGSTHESEAYDDFDVGRDSYVSPFLLPPGSQQAGGAGGTSAMLAHSGMSGNTSGKWQNEVLVRHQTWLLMEYCDRGCLQDAIDRGWLRTSPSAENSAPRMDAVLATAIELASALSYLHSKDIVHGDLSAWNVMLCTSGSTAPVGGRGFVAKIADFGLARHLDIRTKIQTRTYGTLTHMPAETLRDGVISKATDVYSMGVLLWQLFTGSRPWAGLRHGQIIVMVVTQGARLRFTPGCPSAFEELAMACMESDPSKRPTIESVLAGLEAIRKEVC
ncbi:hypothetical protein Agub_g3381 [Astrephomene gubernaculifera]|uniref:Protein kinase domain-containing protein n=1 Tax=Astrephomene gubernaculifera TaxID=47775 RepID=A0AAD3DKU7_9CHLO|nr:hypothetical protein Agub_g3381 [Astrephomene gubernaculifera]